MTNALGTLIGAVLITAMVLWLILSGPGDAGAE
jgi:hypothetical protein